jgi:hypothetical protein
MDVPTLVRVLQNRYRIPKRLQIFILQLLAISTVATQHKKEQEKSELTHLRSPLKIY